MNCEYVKNTYNIPAEIGRRVTVSGKPGIIAEDKGNYIGVNFDHDEPGVVYPCHPKSQVEYGEIGEVRPCPLYTKGPWIIDHATDHRDGSKHMYLVGDEYLLGKVFTEADAERPGNGLANANLMVASPEMLKVCEKVVHLLLCDMEGIELGKPTPEQWESLLDEANAAISLAKGEA